MKTSKFGQLVFAFAVIALETLPVSAASPDEQLNAISLGKLPRIATIDDRYQSYNVEIAEVIGGNFWKPYNEKTEANSTSTAPGSGMAGLVGEDPNMFQARKPIDLSNSRLRKLAAALGPAYVRVSGSWANTVYFHDSDERAPATPPEGFKGVLSRRQWKGVIDFARAANAKLVTSFAISAGVRDNAGVWKPDQARSLLEYTKSASGQIAAAEFFNEPTMPEYGGAPKGYDAAAYAKDYVVFRTFAKAAAPEMMVIGPCGVGEDRMLGAMGDQGGVKVLKTKDLLSADPQPKFDIYSYHFYGAASIRCASMGAGAQTTAEAALSEEWLARTDDAYDFYIGLRDRFQAGKGAWITETADAACGGNPWAKTFLDSFRYLDQFGRLAKRGVNVIFHNTLASSEYGLLDQSTFAPRPNYWAGLLWRKFMGTTVFDAGPSREGFHIYAHSLRDYPGGVALLVINNSRSKNTSLELLTAAERYTLTADKLESEHVRLNGKELRLESNDELPKLEGKRTPSGRVEFAPTSITFLVIPNAANTPSQSR